MYPYKPPISKLTLLGISRGFGFLRFPTLEKSKSFVEHNYPNIYLYGKHGPNGNAQAAKVRIAFSRERDERRAEKGEGEWTCKIVCKIELSVLPP